MNRKKYKFILGTLITTLAVGNAQAVTKSGAEFVGETVYPAIVTVDLSQVEPSHQWKQGDPIKEIPLRFQRPKGWQRPEAAERGFGFDPLAKRQLDLGTNNFDFNTMLVNTEGQGFSGVNPSDTNGDIGIDYYIQSINNSSSSGVLILDKNDGTTVAQFSMSAIAAGSGTGCGSGRGDPIILFDQLADNGAGQPKGRWVLTEFTSTSFCVYISKTHNPTGSQDSSTWYIYEFSSASGGLPDYPKFGVWQDAYYVGANENNRQYAFDRTNMLNGSPARGYQVFSTAGLPGFGFQHMMPADADGETPPPAGSPGIFMRHRDSEYHGDAGGDDVLEIWEFTTDFDTPANSSITGPTNIVVSEFDTNLGGTSFGDLSVPQPSGTNLFPLKQPLMWRVQYRIIDDKQYLVGNMVTDVDGNDYHGVRWWQLERPITVTSGGWTLKDEGTYTLNDGVHRWMASAAMDGSGNIAIGYNTSGSSVYPGMRYAGRLADDPAGTMPRGEVSIIEGSASNGSSRYGDYSSISVDPVDDCTFWYSSQYNPSSSWSTRVASFRFESCGCLLNLNSVTISGITTPSDNTVEIAWDDSSDAVVSGYKVYRSTVSGGGYLLLATVADSSPGVANSGQYSYQDTTVSAGTVYYYIVRPTDGAKCDAPQSNEVNIAATGVCTLAPQFSGIDTVSNQAQNTCSLQLQWTAANSMCPNGSGDITYSIYRSTVDNFTPSAANQIATDITATDYMDNQSVASNVDYYYIVRATDPESNLTDDNSKREQAAATGPIQPQVFDENLDGYADMAAAEAAGWSHAANVGTDDWRLQVGSDHTSGSGNAFVSTNTDAAADKFIKTKAFSPSATSVLSFYHKFAFENGYDGGVLEISVDGGANWQDLGSNITSGGYNVTLNGGYGQPLGAVPAWGNDQTDFGLVEVNLSSFAGQVAQVRWRMGTDGSVGDGDWVIDDITISNSGSYGICSIGVDLIFKNGFEQAED